MGRKNICLILALCLCILSFDSFSQVSTTKHELNHISIAEERDQIYSLAAYVVVLNDWQIADGKKRRGHNIGCILVDSVNMPVAWNRNTIDKSCDATQHGEVRVMQEYISKSRSTYLDGYTVYTTLEPCIMCAGMMCLVKLTYCVYGQTDGAHQNNTIGYGNAIERLKLDSYNPKDGSGYKPYPRTPKYSKTSELPYRAELDSLYKESDERSITNFLLTEEAKSVYIKAEEEFKTYKVIHSENRDVYKETKRLLRRSEKKR